jgi:hypothetical protein
VTAPVASLQAFERVLSEDLRPPAYLTLEEIRGGWRELFPDLAACLPAPYPIFGADEERIITYGYPILISEGIWRLRRELDRLVELETAHRLSGPSESADKEPVAAQRDRYLRAAATIFENVLMNDYGRGLSEVFLLFLSGDAARSLGQVAKQVRLARPEVGRDATEEIRQFLAGVVGELIQRAAVRAADLRQLAEGPPASSCRLCSAVCQDQLLLTESRAPAEARSPQRLPPVPPAPGPAGRGRGLRNAPPAPRPDPSSPGDRLPADHLRGRQASRRPAQDHPRPGAAQRARGGAPDRRR